MGVAAKDAAKALSVLGSALDRKFYVGGKAKVFVDGKEVGSFDNCSFNVTRENGITAPILMTSTKTVASVEMEILNDNFHKQMEFLMWPWRRCYYAKNTMTLKSYKKYLRKRK